jgi:NitT/TauT family transport system permease protein
VASTGDARTLAGRAAARQPAARQPATIGLAARLRPALVPAASIAGLVLLWYLGAVIADDPRRLPAPGAVLHAIALYTASGELPYHLGVTLLRVAASFVIAMAIGTAIGVAMGRAPLFDRIAHPWLVFFLNIPALVTIVLAYIWIGLVESALIFAVAVNKIPNAVVTVREGARALERDLLEMAAVFRIGRRRTLQHVVLPQLYPYLAAAARSGLALIWKIVLVTELLGRSSGVGFQIGLRFQLFDVTGILAYALAFVAVIQLIEWTVLLPLERHVGRWRR